jgi:hypothetical protein
VIGVFFFLPDRRDTGLRVPRSPSASVSVSYARDETCEQFFVLGERSGNFMFLYYFVINHLLLLHSFGGLEALSANIRDVLSDAVSEFLLWSIGSLFSFFFFVSSFSAGAYRFRMAGRGSLSWVSSRVCFRRPLFRGRRAFCVRSLRRIGRREMLMNPTMRASP